MHGLVPLLGMFLVVVVMPWIVLHHISQWKRNATLTREDENLLDELHELARRLDERVRNVERIVTAENPNWKEIVGDAPASVENRNEIPRRIK